MGEVRSINQDTAFQKVGRHRSARIGMKYRALAIETDGGLVWFWIGTRPQYDRLVE